MNKIFMLIYMCFSFILGYSQSNNDSLDINIKLQFNKQSIKLEKQYISKKNDTLSFNLLRFYLSNFEIHYTDKTIYKEENSYHLIDIEDPKTLKIKLKKRQNKEVKHLKFNLGIDSLANVSGAMNGDLDATKGMYWSWQRGFINLKIEGKSPSCNTRKNKFQFHVGGYLKPNNALREIIISPIKVTNNKIVLIMEFSKLFSEISLNDNNTVMSPGTKAMKIADLLAEIFSIQ